MSMTNESPRVLRRLQLLRRWSHEEINATRCSPEVVERAVRLVFEAMDQYDSQWEAIYPLLARLVARQVP
jgi:hypothetical protein